MFIIIFKIKFCFINFVSKSILEESKDAILTYERHIYNHEFHNLIYVLDSYIRKMNKYWVNNMRLAEKTNNNPLRKQVLIDVFHKKQFLG